MGRMEPSQGLPPPSFRKDARAKKAKATVNKVIPSLLSVHPRAKRGIELSELLLETSIPVQKQKPGVPAGKNRSSGIPGTLEGPRLFLQVADTLVAAHSLLQRESRTGKIDLSNKEAKVGILNMASPLSPGGGFLNGASSQEESLSMRTTLLPSLRDEFYRLPELGAVYTPDVLVFRDEKEEDLDKNERWFVDCVSAAMLRMPETEFDETSGQGRYTNDKDREYVVRKMRTVMKIFQGKGSRKVVLGAWGCGAYGNPLEEVAAAWRKVLLGTNSKGKGRNEAWDGIEEVVFAIKDASMAQKFERAFGQELIRQDVGETIEEEPEADLVTIRMRELQDKIQDMETRMEQSRSPQLKSGLGMILTGLKKAQQEEEKGLAQGSAARATDDEDNSEVGGEQDTEESNEEVESEEEDGDGYQEGG